jgi:hypothetical protein
MEDDLPDMPEKCDKGTWGKMGSALACEKVAPFLEGSRISRMCSLSILHTVGLAIAVNELQTAMAEADFIR